MLIRPSGSAFFALQKNFFREIPVNNIHVLYVLFSAPTGTYFPFIIIIHFCFCFIKKHVKYITFLLLSLSHRASPSCFKLYM
ncbi:hypothetical protein CHH96_08255 [Bacillus licheniformis]|nr:hypothetical protein BKP29_0218200 [Bacillus licheniformis]OLQ48388.1 hypothetical protein BHT96_13160 [Bacillus licheniformis]PAD01929.1 hypothetical protein CHH89_06980 [Bacillus licheniformis]PAD51529.1 hypothetical protein CHH98_08045 [Bacillus licheniformis]PAE39897.1 hypothetical protein CHH96_08255 [Bacillus licheniformis]